MKIIYFAQFIGRLGGIAEAFAIALGIVFIISAFLTTVSIIENSPPTSVESAKKWRNGSGIGLIISVLITLLCPTTKEFYEIYGVGSALDYARNNEQIQKWPDKVVEAIDLWLDEKTKNNHETVDSQRPE